MRQRLVKSEKLAAIGELATMVAHDLRNPLQAIATANHCVRKATQDLGNEKMHLLVQRIDDAVKYSDKIIKNLLDYSENIRLDLIEMNPDLIINHALSRITIPEQIKVIKRTSQEPKIKVDIDRLNRVIVNLVSNAFDAMPNGGELTISSRKVRDYLELSFSDTGVGISKEKMDRLWTPFVTTKAKGMGLGLPISKRIIDAHGGDIQVETQKGKGTTFTIRLPLNQNRNQEIEFTIEKPQITLFEQTEKSKFQC